jgi:hypothetical protein
MIMKNMTYRELLDQLKAFRDNDLDLNVSVYVRGVDEHYPVKSVEITGCADVLDAGHPFLMV